MGGKCIHQHTHTHTHRERERRNDKRDREYTLTANREGSLLLSRRLMLMLVRFRTLFSCTICVAMVSARCLRALSVSSSLESFPYWSNARAEAVGGEDPSD